MTVLLYGMDISHYVVKVKRILAHKGIPYEFEYAPYHDRQDLLAVSGQDYVPYLLWEDKGVAWYDIPDFLEAKKPTPTLYPANKHLVKILEGWAHDTVEEMAWRIAAPGARKTFKDPREAWVFEELQMRKRGDLDELATQKPKHEKALVSTLKEVEGRLGEAHYLFGAEPSVADFALYGALHCLPYSGNEIPKALPNVRAWYERTGKLGK